MTDFNLNDEFDKEYEANITLCYEYIEKSLKEMQDLSNHTNTQLGLLIGFNFTFIRFFISVLPDNSIPIDSLPCNSCLLLKLLAYLLAAISIFCCFRGLYRSIEYFVIPANLLIDKCSESSTIGLKRGILRTWNKKLEQFVKLNKQKKELLNKSIILIAILGSFAVIDYAIAFLMRFNII
ncbi:MAG: hypothetical protein AAGE84_31590 [Cyanobacteria bacterium P01_G01_bin.39]